MISRHLLLLLDALLIDEMGTLSNQQLKFCESPLPFVCLLILESLHQHQIGVINAMLLLTTTWRTFKQSNYAILLGPSWSRFPKATKSHANQPIWSFWWGTKKSRFFELFNLFPFVSSWDHPTILPNTTRLFAKMVPVTASLKNYTKADISRYKSNGTSNIIQISLDSQRGANSIGEHLPANAKSRKTLKKSEGGAR